MDNPDLQRGRYRAKPLGGVGSRGARRAKSRLTRPPAAPGKVVYALN